MYSQWLKWQCNDHKHITFDLNHSRSCSTQCFTLENHPRSILQLKIMITVEIWPLSVNFEFLKPKFTENGYVNIIFDLDHLRSRSKTFFTSENHPESFLQLRFTIIVETWPTISKFRDFKVLKLKRPGVITNPMGDHKKYIFLRIFSRLIGSQQGLSIYLPWVEKSICQVDYLILYIVLGLQS